MQQQNIKSLFAFPITNGIALRKEKKKTEKKKVQSLLLERGVFTAPCYTLR